MGKPYCVIRGVGPIGERKRAEVNKTFFVRLLAKGYNNITGYPATRTKKPEITLAAQTLRGSFPPNHCHTHTRGPF